MSRPTDDEIEYERWKTEVAVQERQADALEKIAELLGRLVTLAEGDDATDKEPA